MYVTLQNDKRFDKYIRGKSYMFYKLFENLIKTIVHEGKARK